MGDSGNPLCRNNFFVHAITATDFPLFQVFIVGCILIKCCLGCLWHRNYSIISSNSPLLRMVRCCKSIFWTYRRFRRRDRRCKSILWTYKRFGSRDRCCKSILWPYRRFGSSLILRNYSIISSNSPPFLPFLLLRMNHQRHFTMKIKRTGKLTSPFLHLIHHMPLLL
jgi:hypothetical protein